MVKPDRKHIFGDVHHSLGAPFFFSKSEQVMVNADEFRRFTGYRKRAPHHARKRWKNRQKERQGLGPSGSNPPWGLRPGEFRSSSPDRDEPIAPTERRSDTRCFRDEHRYVHLEHAVSGMDRHVTSIRSVMSPLEILACQA